MSGQQAAPPPQQSYSPPPQQSYSPPPQQAYSQPPQQSYSQPSYTPPGQSAYGSPASLNEPLTVGNYIVMMLLSSITCGIALLVWAFSSNTNINKKNYARAILIVSLIGAAISIIISIAMGGLLASIFSSNGGYSSW